MKKKIKLDWNAIKRIPIFANVIRMFNPGYSYCMKCKLPWNWCEPKSVKHSESSGTFATCDVCWENSTLDELKSYYMDVYNKQSGCGYEMGHTLKHLLKCVEKEYENNRKI